MALERLSFQHIHDFHKTNKLASAVTGNVASFRVNNDIPTTAKDTGLVRDSNPGPLAPKARIIPLDQRATADIS